MTHAEAIQILDDITAGPPYVTSINEVHALFFAIACMRSMTPQAITMIDDLLDLEATTPRP